MTRVQEKVFIGETERAKKEKRKKVEIIHIAVFKKGDTRTITMPFIATEPAMRALSSVST